MVLSEWNAIFPSHWNRRPQKPWRAWRTLLSQLPADVHRRWCKSWLWKLRTYAKMNLSDFGICNNRQNKNYKLLLIIPCKIDKYGIEYLYSHNFGENENIFFKLRIVAESLPYKSKNLCIKISHGCREIAFCPVGYFNFNMYLPFIGE